MSEDHSRLKQGIIERIRLMSFLCIYCKDQNPMAASLIDFEYNATGSSATAFFICPECRNKFTVRIQDVGKLSNI